MAGFRAFSLGGGQTQSSGVSPGGDPHLFPCAAIRAGLVLSREMGEDSVQAAAKFKAAARALRRWLQNRGWP